MAALIEEERLQREQIEHEEELKRLAEEKRLVYLFVSQLLLHTGSFISLTCV